MPLSCLDWNDTVSASKNKNALGEGLFKDTSLSAIVFHAIFSLTY